MTTLTDAERERFKDAFWAAFWATPVPHDYDVAIAAVVAARDADRTADLRAQVMAWRDEAIQAQSEALTYKRSDQFSGESSAYNKVLAWLDAGGDA